MVIFGTAKIIIWIQDVETLDIQEIMHEATGIYVHHEEKRELT